MLFPCSESHFDKTYAIVPRRTLLNTFQIGPSIGQRNRLHKNESKFLNLARATFLLIRNRRSQAYRGHRIMTRHIHPRSQYHLRILVTSSSSPTCKCHNQMWLKQNSVTWIFFPNEKFWKFFPCDQQTFYRL